MDGSIDVVVERTLDDVNASPHPALRRMIGSKSGGGGRPVELRRPAVRLQSVGPLHPVASHAVELAAEHAVATGPGLCPRPHHEGRPMAHVLRMPAVEVRDPVSELVETEAGDCAFHGVIASVAR